MKTYRKFSSEMEARLCAGLLEANGLQTNVVGAKDYSTFVVGGTEGLYSLLLHEKDFATADQVLTNLEENKD